MTQKTKIQKIVTVLAVYKFRNVARICFSVLSSNGTDKYHTCFQGNGRESCDCPSKGGCYHRDQLRPQAQAYFESQKQQAHAATAEKRVLSDESFESFEYLGTQLRHVEEEQEDGTIITWSLKPDGTRKKIAQTWPLKQQAPTHEVEGKLPQETRQSLYNWKQSVSGDEIEREYEENRRSYQRMMESEY